MTETSYDHSLGLMYRGRMRKPRPFALAKAKGSWVIYIGLEGSAAHCAINLEQKMTFSRAPGSLKRVSGDDIKIRNKGILHLDDDKKLHLIACSPKATTATFKNINNALKRIGTGSYESGQNLEQGTREEEAEAAAGAAIVGDDDVEMTDASAASQAGPSGFHADADTPSAQHDAEAAAAAGRALQLLEEVLPTTEQTKNPERLTNIAKEILTNHGSLEVNLGLERIVNKLRDEGQTDSLLYLAGSDTPARSVAERLMQHARQYFRFPERLPDTANNSPITSVLERDFVRQPNLTVLEKLTRQRVDRFVSGDKEDFREEIAFLGLACVDQTYLSTPGGYATPLLLLKAGETNDLIAALDRRCTKTLPDEANELSDQQLDSLLDLAANVASFEITSETERDKVECQSGCLDLLAKYFNFYVSTQASNPSRDEAAFYKNIFRMVKGLQLVSGRGHSLILSERMAGLLQETLPDIEDNSSEELLKLLEFLSEVENRKEYAGAMAHLVQNIIRQIESSSPQEVSSGYIAKILSSTEGIREPFIDAIQANCLQRLCSGRNIERQIMMDRGNSVSTIYDRCDDVDVPFAEGSPIIKAVSDFKAAAAAAMSSRAHELLAGDTFTVLEPQDFSIFLPFALDETPEGIDGAVFEEIIKRIYNQFAIDAIILNNLPQVENVFSFHISSADDRDDAIRLENISDSSIWQLANSLSNKELDRTLDIAATNDAFGEFAARVERISQQIAEARFEVTRKAQREDASYQLRRGTFEIDDRWSTTHVENIQEVFTPETGILSYQRNLLMMSRRAELGPDMPTETTFPGAWSPAAMERLRERLRDAGRREQEDG